ncbi:hypothetical protein ACFLZI_03655 [Nitrospirota bacterium]
MASLRAYMPYVLIGFVSMLMQITLLRELLSVFVGNELDIGITLAVWLLAVGFGSIVGIRLEFRKAFGLSFIFAGLLIVPAIFSISYIRSILGVVPGELIPLGLTILSIAAILSPLCVFFGAQYPLAVKQLKEFHATGSAAIVYGLESIGAFVGGVTFTFVLAGRQDVWTIALVLGILYIAFGAYILGKRVYILLLIIPIALWVLRAEAPEQWPGEIVERVQSRYGEVIHTEHEGQQSIYSSGNLVFTYPSTLEAEIATHIPMVVKPDAHDVVLLGGPSEMLREYLKYDLGLISYVESDPVLLEVMKRTVKGRDAVPFNSGRVIQASLDGRRYIKSLPAGSIDLLSITLPPPSTAMLNRFYTREFFSEVADVLRSDGVLSIRVPSSSGYISRYMRDSNGAVFNALTEMFKYVEMSTEEYGFLFASDSVINTDSILMAKRFTDSGVETAVLHASMVEDAFAPMRIELHRKRLASAESINTDSRPVSYLHTLQLWADMQKSWFLALVLGQGKGLAIAAGVLVFVIALALFRRRTPVLMFSAASGGFVTMSFMVVAILGFQALYGYIYEMYGFLSALFMAAVAAGTLFIRNASVNRLVIVEIAFALFALLSVMFLGTKGIYIAICIGAGLLGGVQYSLVARSVGKDVTHGGRVYAFDLLGAFIGALTVSILFVPVVGIKGVLFLCVWIKLISALLVGTIRDEAI